MKDEILLLVITLWVLIIVLVCCYKDVTNSLVADPETATLTDATPTEATPTEATVTDATPDEPDEVSISVNPEYMDSEDTLEASEIVLDDEAKEIDLEDVKIVSEASDELVEGEVVPFKEPNNDGMTYLGSYTLTAYAWTGNPCANGNYPSLGYTVANNSIPIGSRIYIEGYGEYVVEDRGGMASNVIDVYLEDYNSCVQFGRRKADVYLLE
jgi:3D (Asp-Asp-Asp) domain-containing protein